MNISFNFWKLSLKEVFLNSLTAFSSYTIAQSTNLKLFLGRLALILNKHLKRNVYF